MTDSGRHFFFLFPHYIRERNRGDEGLKKLRPIQSEIIKLQKSIVTFLAQHEFQEIQNEDDNANADLCVLSAMENEALKFSDVRFLSDCEGDKRRYMLVLDPHGNFVNQAFSDPDWFKVITSGFSSEELVEFLERIKSRTVQEKNEANRIKNCFKELFGLIPQVKPRTAQEKNEANGIKISLVPEQLREGIAIHLGLRDYENDPKKLFEEAAIEGIIDDDITCCLLKESDSISLFYYGLVSLSSRYDYLEHNLNRFIDLPEMEHHADKRRDILLQKKFIDSCHDIKKYIQFYKEVKASEHDTSPYVLFIDDRPDLVLDDLMRIIQKTMQYTLCVYRPLRRFPEQAEKGQEKDLLYLEDIIEYSSLNSNQKEEIIEKRRIEFWGQKVIEDNPPDNLIQLLEKCRFVLVDILFETKAGTDETVGFKLTNPSINMWT